MPTRICQFDPDDWAAMAVQVIQNRIEQVRREKGECGIMLTGGRSAQRLYEAWALHPSFSAIQGVRFFFSDERCVLPESSESNYGMTVRTLFSGNPVRINNIIHRMEGESADPDAAARRYESILPERIDVLLLGVGEDGHIASLFPGSAALNESRRRVVPVVGPKAPYNRLTITPGVIANAAAVFLIANGSTKAAVLHRAMRDPLDYASLPARLVLNATWLLDAALPAKMSA